jgi:hypothetical protein
VHETGDPPVVRVTARAEEVAQERVLGGVFPRLHIGRPRSSQSAAPAAGSSSVDGASAAFRLAHRIHHVAGEGGAAGVVVLLLDEDGLVEDVADQGVDESRDRRMHALARHDAPRGGGRCPESHAARRDAGSDNPDVTAAGARRGVAGCSSPRPADRVRSTLARICRAPRRRRRDPAGCRRGGRRRAGLALVVAVRRAAARRWTITSAMPK